MKHFEDAMKKIRPLSNQEISMYYKVAEKFGKPTINSHLYGNIIT